MTLTPGSLFGNRFDIDRMVARGGMGVIYRAHDRYTGQPVALKLLLSAEAPEAAAAERFICEAQLLAQLRHPHVVSYVAHGQTPEGQLFLATGWLDGEDLASRLATLGLTLAESLLCIRTAAAGLQAAHERGIIHRDVKPGNLFLRDGRVESTTVLDFGIARPELMAQALTATGCAIGTPNYMAPEQARGERVIGPAVDIFSLGCVLFQCLTGRPPFIADQPMAVLSKILGEEAPSVRTFRPHTPEAVDALLKQMLAKNPRQRPQHGGALREALDAIRDRLLEQEQLGDQERPAVVISGEGQLLLCVIVGLMAQRTQQVIAATNDLADDEELPTMPISIAAIPAATQDDPIRVAVEAVARFHGAQAKWMADGSLVVTLVGRKPVTDLVQAGARCALAIAKAWPEAQISMATGRGIIEQELPTGDTLDRAFKLARSSRPRNLDRDDFDTDENAGLSPAIAVDDASTGLLDGRYLLDRQDAGVALLTGESNSDEGRRLMGKPTPYVGRDQELNLLTALFTSCVENCEAHAVLIVSGGGGGKSRLKHEFLVRVQKTPQAPLIVTARGDMQSPGVPYLLLGQALRRLIHLQDGMLIAEQRERLATRLGQQVADSERRFVCEFVGELCGVHFGDEDSPQLRAARSDPRLMWEHMTRAFTLFIGAECKKGAVVLVLDDLHWGDAQSTQLIDAALRDLRDQPLLVLALGRPEVNERFPNLWKSHKRQELVLKVLTKRACQRLVEHVIGKNLEPSAMARLIEQSSGNPLFLEELIRMVGEGRIGVIADSVLAMVQNRILELSPRLRRILLAASIFGPEFWRGGVELLASAGRESGALELELAELEQAEFIERQRMSRYAGEEEYSLRNSVFREAAYGLLTAEERQTAHRLAGSWLQKVGESDPMTLALHHELGGVPDTAVHYYVLAAELAMERYALAEAIKIAQRGQACGATGHPRGLLLAVEALSNSRLWRFGEAMRLVPLVLELLPPSSRYPCLLHGLRVAVTVVQGKLEEAREHSRSLILAEPAPEARNDYVRGALLALNALITASVRDLSDALLAKVKHVQRQAVDLDINVTASVCHGWSDYTRAFQADPWQVRQLAMEAANGHKVAGDQTDYLAALVRCGQIIVELGDPVLGIQTLREVVAQAERNHDQIIHGQGLIHLAAALARLPNSAAWQEADSIARGILATPNIMAGYKGWAHGVLALGCLNRNEWAQAETEAEAALAKCQHVPLRRLWLKTLIGGCLIGRGRASRQFAQELIDEVDLLGCAGYIEVAARLAAVEILLAAGESDKASVQLLETLRQIQIRAEKIPELAWRTRYLDHVEENVRARRLAQKWLPEHEFGRTEMNAAAGDFRDKGR